MSNWDKDNFEDENLENLEDSPQPIDGQIGIEELYVRQDENEEDEKQVFVEPIEGQMTFEEYQQSKGYEYKDDANTGDIVVTDEISLDRNKHLENLNDFFKEEKPNENFVENKNEETNKTEFENEQFVIKEKETNKTEEFANETKEVFVESESTENNKTEFENEEIENKQFEDDEFENLQVFEEDKNLQVDKNIEDIQTDEEEIESNLIIEQTPQEELEEDKQQIINEELNKEEVEEDFVNEENKKEVEEDFNLKTHLDNTNKAIEDNDRTALDNFFKQENTPNSNKEEQTEEEVEYEESSSIGANRALKNYKGFSSFAKNDDFAKENVDENFNNFKDEKVDFEEDTEPEDDEFSKFLEEKFLEKETEENLKEEDQNAFKSFEEKEKQEDNNKKEKLVYESSFDEGEENKLNNLLTKTNNELSNEEDESEEETLTENEKQASEVRQDKKEKEGNINLDNEENKNSTHENMEEVEKISKAKEETAVDENFFENEENSETIKDVDKRNKDIKDIDVNVGKDVFSNYVSNTLEASEVNEKEVEVKQEKVYSEDSGHDVIDGMLYKSLDSVLHESMIPYSEHVILDRALPRVEDGLKPVQRRILYSMLELGVTPDKPYRKSARIVGDCLGKYHPHGDSSVYQAMVRMAQPFNQNELLVSGHGNFGSVDGDGAAAMRYTEARLAPLAMELLRDLDKNTVKWGLNFDDTLKEPEILPGRFPNLLVNGAMGIAVGLATNIPPHNLAETIDGVVAYINKPSITLKEMLKVIKGPDFPTGGYILNSSEIIQAYETGKGKFYLRAKMHIESNGSDKRYIVITELPYQVNKSSLLQKIANYREEGKYGFDNISEIRDESDRDGLRAVIRVKKDADLKVLYESLLKNTELQTTFGMNMVAIANGKPKQMGLLDIISYYSEYQREVILRRSKYDLEQAKEREHILSGLIIAIKNIDAVVKIIKTSQNTTEAKKRLREKFVLSEKQAQAILDMRLARLTSLEVYKLEAEIKKLRELIKHLTAVINSKKLQYDIVKEELLQIKKQYKSERKTRMMRSDESIKIDEGPKEMPAQNVVILKSANNTFKCLNTKQYNYANKEVGDNNTLFDVHVLKFETESTKTLLAFTNLGNCFKVDVKEFGESRYRDKGIIENKIFKELGSKETVIALFDFEETKGKENLMFLTKFGMIKKTALSEYGLLKRYFQAMKLRDDDEILSIVKESTVENYTVVLVSKTGMILNAESKDIPLQGRISGGVKGINLSDKDYCVGVSISSSDAGEVICVTDKGYSKRVLLSNIDKMARYRKGLKFITFDKNNGNSLIFAGVVTNTYTLGCVDKDNNLYYRSTDLVAIEARIGKGKPVDKTKKNLSIVHAFKIDN